MSLRRLTRQSPSTRASTIGAFAAVILAAGVLAAPPLVTPAKAGGLNAAKRGPGCDPDRPAVAHRAGGVPLASLPSVRGADPVRGSHSRPMRAPIPCVVEVGPTTETANIGVTSNGTVFYAPWVTSDVLPVNPDRGLPPARRNCGQARGSSRYLALV
jgi:hypothetical protein